MLLQSCLPPKKSERSWRIFGMRVEPPTSTTSSMASLWHAASLSTCLTTSMQLSNSREHSDSNLARVMVVFKSTPPANDSTSISAEGVTERVHLAFSTAACRRRNARSPTSTSALSFLNVLSKNCTTLLSKSSPPSRVFPPVAFTSNRPASIDRIETSNVPPPRSKMSTLRSSPEPATRSRPYARAAAVGSLMMRMTCRPAMLPASLVACLCWSLKWAGTVMTALVTFWPRKVSAESLRFSSTMAEICSGANFFC
mmetsp:Transcript_31404/g.76976  ORF Transcript_31404/g.76976 Transcript_31404/m.76976 type:complete len:255 (+) Transcript_31404:871-1635(+)